MKPFLLEPNQPRHFYSGGSQIARLRGTPVTVPPAELYYPEDWVASTVSLFDGSSEGLTVLPDGRTLRDAVQADPEGFLGPDHVAEYGADPALLVKLLDAGERLPVHVHPDRAFAGRHLDCRFGKTEAWIVLDTDGPTGDVWLGFQQDISRDEVDALIGRQDRDGLLGRLNRLAVSAGDGILVPAGQAHAIGAGVLVVELQEPTDFSIFLEWEGYAFGGESGATLGLDPDLAYSCLDRSGWTPERIATLRSRRGSRTIGAERLLPEEADQFFRAEWLHASAAPSGAVPLEPSFTVLVVTGGEGVVETEHGGVLPLTRGQTALVPYASGPAQVRGELDAIRCRPAAVPAGERQ
jgi:mannose-6-phosphate isomerase